MRPLLGLENSNYHSNDHEDEDADGVVTASGSSNAALVKALQGMHQRPEEDADDAMLDALCKAPGGACAVPQKKGKGKRGDTQAAAASAAATPASTPASSEATPMTE
jgi:hypothetical protein